MDFKRLIVAFCIFATTALLVIMFALGQKSQIDKADTADEIQNIEASEEENETDNPLVAANKRKAEEANLLERTEENMEIIREEEKERYPDVSLILSSVAKDIRIRIMSGDEVLSGVRWVVDVADEDGNSGVFADEDRDGLLHINDLSSGKYYVLLEPEPGYILPTEATTVRIRDQISYTAIPDISFEIKTEDEIDAAKEDTAQSDEIDNGNNYQIVSAGIYGIDVSKWNKDIDWTQVKNAGVEYAIIRCGYRGSSTGALVMDPYYQKNFDEARAAGIKVGIYFFTQAVNESEAIEEASVVLSLLGGNKIEYPVFLDVEGSGGRADGIDNATRTQVIKAFCQTISSAGYEAGVYANKNWFTNKINTNELSGITKWLAQYNVSEPTYEGDYNIWQYTSKGSIPGIEGNVDIDLSYIKY